MTKLEAEQTWSNGKTKRRITGVGGSTVSYRAGESRKYQSAFEWTFRAWITRTGATLQETKP